MPNGDDAGSMVRSGVTHGYSLLLEDAFCDFRISGLKYRNLGESISTCLTFTMSVIKINIQTISEEHVISESKQISPCRKHTKEYKDVNIITYGIIAICSCNHRK